MASITPYPRKKRRERWRVSYTVTFGRQKVRRQKYAKLRTDAELLYARFVDLERASHQGYAPEEEIEKWIGNQWITEEEAKTIFRYYDALLKQKKIVEPQETDYQKIYTEFYEWSANNSKDGLRGKTHISRMGYTRRIMEWLKANAPRLEDLKPSHVETYIEELGKKYAPSTVKQTLTILNQYLDTAVDLGMIAQNPSRSVTPPRVKASRTKKILPLEEVQRLKEIATKRSHRDLLSGAMPAVVYLGLYAGLRNSEMCWLRWDQIDLEHRILNIGASRCELTGRLHEPKNYELRRIDVKQELIDFLKQERERQKRHTLLTDFVIPNRRARKPIHPDSLGHAFGKMMDREIAWNKANGEASPDEEITVYCLRHTYATWALRSGVDIATLKQRMGHADITTTMAYLHYIDPERHPMDRLPY